jgi:hypothetical protein
MMDAPGREITLPIGTSLDSAAATLGMDRLR